MTGDECHESSAGPEGLSQEVFKTLFLRYSEELYRYATRLLDAPEDARGIVHDVFERLWRRREQWRAEGGSAQAYLYRAVRSSALDALDHRRVQERYAEERRHTGRALRAAQLRRFGETPPPDAHLEKQELQSALQRAVDALPPRQQEAFRLTNRQGLSYEEAAEVMGVAKSTVAVHVHKALKSLRATVDALRSGASCKSP